MDSKAEDQKLKKRCKPLKQCKPEKQGEPKKQCDPEKLCEMEKFFAEENVEEYDGQQGKDSDSVLSEEQLSDSYFECQHPNSTASDYDSNSCLDFDEKMDIFLTSSEDEDDSKDLTSSGSSTPHRNNRLPRRYESVVMIGDEMIEIAGDLVCRTDVRNITRVCLPGAKISDVLDLSSSIVRGEDIAILQIGTNDIPTKMLNREMARYRMLLNVCKLNCHTIAIGLIPRFDSMGCWINRGSFINNKMKEICQDAGIEFIDVWPKYEGSRSDYYEEDDFTLNRVGVRLLANIILNIITDAKAFNKAI